MGQAQAASSPAGGRDSAAELKARPMLAGVAGVAACARGQHVDTCMLAMRSLPAGVAGYAPIMHPACFTFGAPSLAGAAPAAALAPAAERCRGTERGVLLWQRFGHAPPGRQAAGGAPHQNRGHRRQRDVAGREGARRRRALGRFPMVGVLEGLACLAGRRKARVCMRAPWAPSSSQASAAVPPLHPGMQSYSSLFFQYINATFPHQ